MFPHCSVSISGLQPFANYVIMMDMVPVDSFKYKVNAYATYCGHFLLLVLFCWQKLGSKTNWLQYAKNSSLRSDIGLPILGHSPLHIKAFHCFLFVHSRLEAQSISIPPHSLSVNGKQSAIHTFNDCYISWPIWSKRYTMKRKKKVL